jgi:hypothetical protein
MTEFLAFRLQLAAEVPNKIEDLPIHQRSGFGWGP